MLFSTALFEINRGKILGRRSVNPPFAIYKDSRLGCIFLQTSNMNFSDYKEYEIEFDGYDVIATDWEYVKLTQ